MFRFFSKKRDLENWSAVYTTSDLWESELVRSALLNENIMAAVKSTKGDRRSRQYVVSIPASKLAEAQLVIYRASMVISRKNEIIAEQEERASKAQTEIFEEEQTSPEPQPAGEPVLMAEKDGTGKIFYYEDDDIYELRLEFDFYKRSHFMTGEEWEEFIDFSAQRQEFFILLKEKYLKLARLVKENKKRPDLLKLIEYSYGKSQPPRKKPVQD